MAELPILRVSILRTDAQHFPTLQSAMSDSRTALEPAIRSLPGHRAYIAGADPATLSLVNASLWNTLAEANQMDTLQPMLALARDFVDLGGTFERPIMNHQVLWRLD